MLVFRLESNPDTPNGDAIVQRFAFNSANAGTASERPFFVVMIPEMSPLTLASLSAGLLYAFRRIRKRDVSGS